MVISFLLKIILSLFTYFTLGFCKPYPFLLSSNKRRNEMIIAITPKAAKMVIVWV